MGQSQTCASGTDVAARGIVSAMMIRFSANLGLLFDFAPLRERFQLAADAGFRVVEIWFPHLESLADLVEAKAAAGVQVLQFNMDRIDFAGGERGTLGLPEHVERFRADLEVAIATARRLGAQQFNALAGNRSATCSRADQLECLKDNLRWAAMRLANTDLRLVVEPLSLELNRDYLMPRPSELFAIVEELGSTHVAVLYDIFHAHLAGDDLVATLRRRGSNIGHIQVADAPGRW